MHSLVCLTGLTGSGKTTVAQQFIKAGFHYLRFGQITLDEVKRRGLPPTEANERPIREELRQKYGMGAFALLNLPKIKKLLKQGPVLGDGLYSFAEYKIFKQAFADNFICIAVYASPTLRYQRLSRRHLQTADKHYIYRPNTPENAQSRDYSEIENLDKGGTIAMADYTLLNTQDLQFLHRQTLSIIQQIKNPTI